MYNPFTDHPKDIGETYFEHMKKALSFGFWLLVAAFACIIHAVLPFLFRETASGYVAQLANRLNEGRRREVFQQKLEQYK